VGESSGGSSDLTVALHESSTTQIDASSAPTSSPALGPPLPLANATSIATFDSSTFATNLSWQAPANASGTVTYSVFDLGTASSVASGSAPLWVGTSTAFSAMSSPDGTERRFGVQATDADGNASTIAVASVQTPNWLATVQPYDGNTSFPSWYSDTWYDLGTGFYGTVRSLTLNGAINNPWYFKSHLWLAEFLDPDYTTPGRSWGISDDAPFTATSTLVTMGGLDIPLQPNKYYRLYTYQDYQNRSVVLRGTVATGTAMSNGYVYGTGRVENHYAFYPYLAWTFVPNWPPLLPPDPPPGASVSFDAANLLLNLSWNPTTDPDTASTLLAYQWNVSTSTSFDDAAWQSAGKNLSAQIPLAFPNDYMIGIRAVDDLGDVSAPSVLHWSFPAGYFPLPSQLGHDDGAGAPTEFHLAGPISLSAIGLWTSANIWGWYRASYSMVSLYADASGTPGAFIASAAAMAQDLPPGSEVWHQFDNPIVLSPGDYWITGGWAGGFSNSPNIYGLNGQLYFRLQATYINE
jgi:hypothetical protein